MAWLLQACPKRYAGSYRNKMSTKQKISITIILFLTIVVSGCTVYSELYLRNTAGEPKQVTLISNQNIQAKKFEFVYTDSLIKDIRYKTYNYLDKKLVSNGENKSLTFSVPPNATLHLGAGRNFREQFQKIIIGADTLDFDSNGGFKTNYERFSKYAIWYDIK